MRMRMLSSSSLLLSSPTMAVVLLGLLASSVVARPMLVADERTTTVVTMVRWCLSAMATLLLAQWWRKNTTSTASAKATTTRTSAAVDTSMPMRYLDENFPHDKSAWTWREDGGKSKLVPLHPTPRNTNKPLTKYTVQDVAKHNAPTDAWIIIDERVYDISNFIGQHPGGEKVLFNMAGKDCTDAFANYHSARIYRQWLPPFLIGECTNVPVYPHVQDFRNVRQELLRRGLFQTNPVFYYKLYTWFAALWMTAMYLSLVCSSTAAHLTGAVVLGFFWQQVAGWGHDLGHSSVSHDCRLDNWIGSTVGCLLMGISTGWWRRSHNTHHVVCNSIESDPDIQHLPVFAVSPGVIHKPYWSNYHEKLIQMDWAGRFLVRHQHIIYLPLMMVARFNLYAQSWIQLLTTTNEHYQVMYNRKEEAAALLLYCSWVIAVALQMPTWKEFFAWGFLSHATCCLLHIQICSSHFSRETYHGKAYNDESDEWYKVQLKTTMNVDCYEWMDFFHIGLQFQIEHHLFPTLPRHNLRLARTMVKEVCRKHSIEYYERTFYQSVAETVGSLKYTAMLARSGKYDSPSPQMLIDAMNARG